MRRVFVTYPQPEEALERLAQRAHVVVAPRGVELREGADTPISRQELIRGASGCFGILSTLRDVIDSPVLDATGVRVVANCAVGFDNIDLRGAASRGVWVTNTPDVLTDATADLTVGLILALTRHVVSGDRVVRGGGFAGWSPSFMLGVGLQNRTLGIVGLGRIGRAVARRAAAFGMKVIHCGGRSEGESVEPRELSELLAESDIVSLHVPLSQATRGLIGERELRLMAPGAFLINTSRAAVIDGDALFLVLRDGHLGGAALDVHPVQLGGERVDPRLLEFDNVVLTPHIGSATFETRLAMANRAVDNLLEALEGRKPKDCLT